MATDLEKLAARMSRDIKVFRRSLKRAAKATNRQARAIEARWRRADSNT